MLIMNKNPLNILFSGFLLVLGNCLCQYLREARANTSFLLIKCNDDVICTSISKFDIIFSVDLDDRIDTGSEQKHEK